MVINHDILYIVEKLEQSSFWIRMQKKTLKYLMPTTNKKKTNKKQKDESKKRLIVFAHAPLGLNLFICNVYKTYM